MGDEVDSEYRSPFFALIVNHFLPGFVFWEFGAKWRGGGILVLTLLILPVGASYGVPEPLAGAGVFVLGTGLIGFVVHARKHLQRW